MKVTSLDISEEQEAKLMKMINMFYAHYFRVIIEEGIVKFYDDYEAYYYDDPYSKMKNKAKGVFKMNWFEFCYRYLIVDIDKLYIKKVLNPVDPKLNNNGEKDMVYPDNWKELFNGRIFFTYHTNMNGYNNTEHPVDWLYIEWIKLKRL